MYLKQISCGLAALFSLTFFSTAFSQYNAAPTSAEIYAGIKRLQVLGSVLYIAAHPDDENNGLLPFLAKEKLYRTAYLSLTRGDGGQNLIGSEQGIELGLIRTQELIAARRLDGAEQYFTTAYEFGYSKSATEALRIWNHDKILSDVVWVIRMYQPDVIIKRFPPDARAGHGHHAASAILADEAFVAAADPNRFPEQFAFGVKAWKAKRIVWNTFNFGGNNTTGNDQLKLEVGGYNAMLGKSYGELGGEARSMHKSQGEGRPRRRGSITEYFQTTAGDTARNDLMDGVITNWSKIDGAAAIQYDINNILASYNFEKPSASVPQLLGVYKQVQALPASNWRQIKLTEIQSLVEGCAALFTEAISNQYNAVQGSNMPVSLVINKRSDVNILLKRLKLEGLDTTMNSRLSINQNLVINYNLPVALDKKISQPYWLEQPPSEGSFTVNDQRMIGKAENDNAFMATFVVDIDGVDLMIQRPLLYKVTDPVKGEIYQPIAVLPKLELKYNSDNFVSLNGKPVKGFIQLHSNNPASTSTPIKQHITGAWQSDMVLFNKAATKSDEDLHAVFTPNTALPNSTAATFLQSADERYHSYTKTIAYDHIPTITYFANAKANLVNIDVKTVGKKVGYIAGAGDKLPEALTALQYHVTLLTEAGITDENLKQFDAIVVGIRAHNIYEYLSDKNEVLNRYVHNGGNLIVQYIKSNQVGQNRIKVGPYPFTISAGLRVTEEHAEVTILLPNHPALNYPNKITGKDFEGWVQERSTYQVDQADEHYERLISMHDANDKESNGSLAIAKYGKGNFAYVSLVLFRQLPAGVPGAYRLLANLIALPKGNLVPASSVIKRKSNHAATQKN